MYWKRCINEAIKIEAEIEIEIRGWICNGLKACYT